MLRIISIGIIYLLFLLLLKSVVAEQRKPIMVGIFPYLSAAKLLQLHYPVVEHLNNTLEVNFQMISAPSFDEFILRTQAGEYDLLITAPHMGRLAEMQSDYQRVAMSANLSYAIFIVKNQSPFKSLKDIQDLKITLPPKQAIISQLSIKTLKNAGLNIKETHLNYTQSHNNALLAVIRDEAKVAAIGYPTWQRYPNKDKKTLRVLARSEAIPGFIVLANARIKDGLLNDIQQSLFNFNHTELGKAYFSASALKKFIPVDEQQMQNLTEYVEILFRLQK